MPHTSHTTMVVFTDHPMEDDQWSALVRELQQGGRAAWRRPRGSLAEVSRCFADATW